MSDSVCNFVSSKKYTGGIKPVHFVYETEFHSLRQPFFHAIFSVYLVTKGNGILRLSSSDFSLKKGDIFFSFPSCLYTIEADADFEYMYISFMGDGCRALLDDLGICTAEPVYHGFDHLFAFWENAVKQHSRANIALLTESVLLYTLAFIRADKDDDIHENVNGRTFERIVDYLDKHYRDPDMSLTSLAQVFAYTEKYISSLFAKNMNISFKKYLNILRIQYAYTLIDKGMTSVSEIATLCGYANPLYFSKVFKARRHMTPSEYIKKRGTVE